jgi:division/cell wall cluster transcriptional repressor MraZ
LLDVAYPHPLVIDQRARLCLPVEAREGFQAAGDGTVTAVLGQLPGEPCLWLMTRERYAAFVERIGSRAGETASGRRLKTILLSNFARVTVDAQGRISIPEGLLKAAKIEKSIRLVGHGQERIEIWATEVLEEESKLHADAAVALLEDIFAAEKADARTLGSGRSAGAGEGDGRRV